MKQVLWLCSWFPNEEEPLAGDFLERHAAAASLINKIHVIFIKRSSSPAIPDVIEKRFNENFTAQIVSYYLPGAKLTAFISFFKYVLLQRKLIDKFISKYGKPSVIHVHINLKAGVGALYARRRYGIPYVVSEQWTGFCSNARPAYADLPFWLKSLIRRVFRHSVGCSTVSHFLGKEIEEKFGMRNITRIPNVVDTRVFFPQKSKPAVFQFIHISTLRYQKNFQDILRACAALRNRTNRKFVLQVYGPPVPSIIQMAGRLELGEMVRFNGEVPHQVIAAKLREAHALVLYSRFETFGCVVIEAFASGLPVIVSDIPVMREIVSPGINGKLVLSENPDALADAMLWMMNNYMQFDQEKIAAYAADNFSYSGVAAQFDAFYEKVRSED